MGTRIVFQRRRETDALLSDEPSEDPYFIAKLFGMAFISGGNSGYALNSVGFVLARLVRATRRSQCRASTPRGGLKTQAPRNRSRRKTATKRRFVNGHFTTSHQKNHDFGVSETSRPRPAGHFPGRASARSTLSNERRRSTDLVTEP